MQKVDYVNTSIALLESVKQSLKYEGHYYDKSHSKGNIKNRLKTVRDMTLRLEKELDKRC